MPAMESGASINNEDWIGIIGAGPAGVAAVGQVLDQLPNSKILWIADSFSTAGRLSSFKRVPSNTKIKLFIQYATQSPSFVRAWENGDESLGVLKAMDPNSCCQLGFACDMVKQITENLIKVFGPDGEGRVQRCEGHCSEIHMCSDGLMQLSVSGVSSALPGISRLILATGSHPRSTPPTPNYPSLSPIDPEVLINPICPSEITNHIPPIGGKTVVVVGSSHSAMLILKNLVEAPEGWKPRKIINFYRDKLRFAVELPDGTIKLDNTGLKGDVAQWARRYIVPNEEDHGGESHICFDNLMHRQRAPSDYNKEDCLSDVDFIIWAIGYERNPTPTVLTADGQSLNIVSYDESNRIVLGDGRRLSNVFGMGIAFPERVKDGPNMEYSVGMWKFWRHSKTVLSSIKAIRHEHQ